MLKVVQWATGGVGVAAIRGVLEHPDLELVGCWVHSADKTGRDVGEILDGPDGDSVGVIATNSLDDILALDADAVIYAPLMFNLDEVAALAEAGLITNTAVENQLRDGTELIRDIERGDGAVGAKDKQIGRAHV